jgi:hypothetical protein
MQPTETARRTCSRCRSLLPPLGQGVDHGPLCLVYEHDEDLAVKGHRYDVRSVIIGHEREPADHACHPLTSC